MPAPEYRYCVGTFSKLVIEAVQTVSVADADGPFTPKAVIFFSSQQPADGFGANGQWFLGWMTATKMFSCTSYKQNNVTGLRATRSAMCDSACIMVGNATPTEIFETADFHAFALGNFSINWVSNAGSNELINFIAIGGADVDITAGFSLSPGATGSQVVSVPGSGQITGLLSVNVLTSFCASVGVAGPWSDNVPIIGWADQALNQASLSTHVNNGTFGSDPPLHESFRTLNTTPMIYGFGDARDGIIRNTAAVTALGTGSFTLNWTLTNAPGFYGNAGTYYFAIRGPRVLAGLLSEPSSPSALTISSPWAPGAVLVGSVAQLTNAGAISPSIRWSFGMMDGSANQAVAWLGDDFVSPANPTVSTSYQRSDRLLVMASPAIVPSSATIQSLAVGSLVSSQATLTWSQVTGQQRNLVYLLLEQGEIPVPPPVITIFSEDCGAQHLIIDGTNFPVLANLSLTMTRGSVPITPTIISVSSTEIVVSVPGGLLSGTYCAIVEDTSTGGISNTFCDFVSCSDCLSITD